MQMECKHQYLETVSKHLLSLLNVPYYSAFFEHLYSAV